MESQKPNTDRRLFSKETLIHYGRLAITNKKTLFVIGVVVAIPAVYGITALLNSDPGASSGTHKSVNGPDYQTMLPGQKTINDLGGWRRISPPKNDPVYAYSDTLKNVPISVSQQPLPKSFVGSVDDKMSELAEKFNANTKIDGGDTKVYIGTSAKGPQSVLFTKKDVLVLIKSQKKIANEDWADYVKSLNFSQAGVPNY